MLALERGLVCAMVGMSRTSLIARCVGGACTLDGLRRYLQALLWGPDSFTLLHPQEEAERLLKEALVRWPHLLELWGLQSTLAVGLQLPPRTRGTTHEQILRLSDGGTVRLSWEEPIYGPPLGVVLLCPGLNNSSRWAFVQHLSTHLSRNRFVSVCFDYRGTAGLKLSSPRVGCADSWRDLPEVLAAISAAKPGRPILAIGHSMGGAIVAKHLADFGRETPLAAAAIVSAPLDISAHMAALEATAQARLVNCAMAMMAKVPFYRHRTHAASRSHVAAVDWTALAKATSLRGLEAATGGIGNAPGSAAASS